MSKDQTAEFHAHQVNDAKSRLMEQGDLFHQITFVKAGREQMLVLVPFGPTRAIRAAARAIAESDEADMMSGVTLAWVGSASEHQNYKLGDVGNSPSKDELLMVVTVDRDGNKFTSVSQVFRVGGKVRLEELKVELPSGMIVPELKPIN